MGQGHFPLDQVAKSPIHPGSGPGPLSHKREGKMKDKPTALVCSRHSLSK